MSGLFDSFSRPINYLRLSVTDRCNLRCRYCMPAAGVCLIPRGDILTFEELHLLAQAAVSLGLTKLRLTGGEPLARAGLADLVARLAAIPGLEDLSLTTNGTLLARHAADLKRAGLRRVNISLDTLRPARFRRITRRGQLEDTLEGIQAARDAGLHPVKVNTVVMGGINDDELLDFARLTMQGEWHIRFIERMPFTESALGEMVPIAQVKERLEALGPLEPYRGLTGSGPAKYFRYPGAPGTIGFISPISADFCEACNRLRLTSDGRLRPCLASDWEVDLRGPLRRGASLEELKGIMEKAVAAKPQCHHLQSEGEAPGRPMAQIGG